MRNNVKFMLYYLIINFYVETVVVLAFLGPFHQQQGYSSRSSSSLTIQASSTWDDNVLSNRLMELKKSESLQQQLLNNSAGQIMELSVICMDALLPKQRLSLRTSDPTLGCFLRDSVGLGGLFVMTSLNPTSRLIRRHGVCVKVQALDVVSSSCSSEDNGDAKPLPPTAVDFEIVGVCRCRIVGSRDGMQQRIGRWRRGYDPNGEESMLGWGMERFQKIANDELILSKQEEEAYINSSEDDENSIRPYTEWSTCLVNVDLERMDQIKDEQIMTNADASTSRITNQINTISAMLLEWQELASNIKTFENLNVTATTRIQRGHAGLYVNPKVLIKNVLQELGSQPSAPTAFCYWATAVMNPLPPLGVSLEIRGNMLEAVTLQQRLDILERGLIRSIDNLKGIRPLI